MHINKMKRIEILCLLAALVPGQVWAASAPQGPPSGERRRPPQAAFDACSGKSAGTTVEIYTPGGTIKATCRSFEGQMVAVPEGTPPAPPNGTTSGQ